MYVNVPKDVLEAAVQNWICIAFPPLQLVYLMLPGCREWPSAPDVSPKVPVLPLLVTSSRAIITLTGSSELKMGDRKPIQSLVVWSLKGTGTLRALGDC